MKKFLLITVCATLLYSEVQAQDTNPDSERMGMYGDGMGVFGLRFMPTVSNLDVRNTNGLVEADFLWTIGFGGLIGYNFNDVVGFEVDVIYNKLSQKYQDHNLDRRIDINYINIPVLLSLNTGRSRAINLNFVGGPQIGLNVGSEVTTTGPSNGTFATSAVLAVKKNDFGLAYGVGVDFGINRARTVRLDVGFRGVFGLIDVGDDSGTLQTDQYYILRKGNIETYSAYAGLTFLF